MRKLFSYGRWSVHKLAIAVLANAVAFGILLMAISIHLTNPQVMKDWLAETDTYNTLINESLNLIEREEAGLNDRSLGDSLSSNPYVDNQTVINALRDTITPSFIQTQAEGFIDGIYLWLESDDQYVPNASFSLAARNDQLAQRLAEELKKEFARMPTCTPAELTADFELLDTLCLPEGVDLDLEVDKLVNELAGETGLLSGASWTGEDIVELEGEEGGLSESQVDFAKSAFGGLRNGPLILLLAGLACIPIIFYSSRTQYRGLAEIGNTLFSGSIFVFIPALIVARWENLITSLIGAQEGTSQSSVDAARALFEPFLERAVGDIAQLTAWMSGFAMLIGGLIVLYTLKVRDVYVPQEEDELVAELTEAKQDRRARELKKRAKRRGRHKDKTLDPETEKPLKPAKQSISKEEAQRIATDPQAQTAKVSELLEKQPPKRLSKDGKIDLPKQPRSKEDDYVK